MKIEPQRTVRYYKLRFQRLRGDPDFLAMGVAVGAFIGITPTIPFHTVLVLGLALLLRGSKIAALLTSVLVSNPLTFFFQYYFSWKIGAWVAGSDISWSRVAGVVEQITTGAGFRESLQAVGELGRESILVLVLGGCILALPLSVAAFFLARSFFRTVRKKRQEKHILK